MGRSGNSRGPRPTEGPPKASALDPAEWYDHYTDPGSARDLTDDQILVLLPYCVTQVLENEPDLSDEYASWARAAVALGIEWQTRLVNAIQAIGLERDQADAIAKRLLKGPHHIGGNN